MIRENAVNRCGYRLGKFTKSKQSTYTKYMGKISKNLKVYACEDENSRGSKTTYCFYAVVDVEYNNIVVEVTTQKNSKNIESICMTETDDKYKGFGVAPLLYTFLAKRGIVIRCGSSQSIGAKAMWNSLCKTRGVSVIAGNEKTKEFYPCYPTEYGEIISCVDPYGSKNSYYLYLVAN